MAAGVSSNVVGAGAQVLSPDETQYPLLKRSGLAMYPIPNRTHQVHRRRTGWLGGARPRSLVTTLARLDHEEAEQEAHHARHHR